MVAPVFSTDLNGYMGKEPLEIDEIMYGWRYLVGNFFCNLKAFRRSAMGSGKTDTSFSATI